MPRRPMDFYETSKEAVDALVEHYLKGTFKGEVQILEPCCRGTPSRGTGRPTQ